MTLSLGSIADDYTGASDLANTLTRCGLRTIQTIGVPAADLALPEVDAVVVALKSRSIAARQAVELARAADDWLRARGASHVMFKICSTFDSTDAGNIGPVTDALRAAAGSKIVLVTPAFPATARTVYQGNLFVGSVPLNESPLKDHPLNPMRDANLVRVLRARAVAESASSTSLWLLLAPTRSANASRRLLATESRRRSSMPCSSATSRPSAPSRSKIESRSERRARLGAGAGASGPRKSCEHRCDGTSPH